jgi:hypothetical protein
MGPSDKHVTKIGAGPGGMTIKGPDMGTILAYIAAKEGFYTQIIDGRVWVFAYGDGGLADFIVKGPSDKHSTKIGAGPAGMTVKGPDMDTILDYIAAKPGFYTKVIDGRVWVFKGATPELMEFLAMGPSDKHSTKVGAGPGGMTVKAPNSKVITEYVIATDGFHAEILDGRLWVFRQGSKELANFMAKGPSDKHSTKVGAGPERMTVKGPDMPTINAYLRACGVAARKAPKRL